MKYEDKNFFTFRDTFLEAVQENLIDKYKLERSLNFFLKNFTKETINFYKKNFSKNK